MALSKTHINITLLASLRKYGMDEGMEVWKEIIPYVVLPDAIRCFPVLGVPNNRVYSHFEINPENGEASWMTFPTVRELKVLDEKMINELPRKWAGTNKQVAIGDETSIHTFLEYNTDADPEILIGCLIHLVQDRMYDKYIRGLIDCSERLSSGTFKYDGQVFDAKAVRTLIAQIEELEFRWLVKKIYNEFSIKADKKMFEVYVKPALEDVYCAKMAETTWKYINFNEDVIPRWIANETAERVIEEMVSSTMEIIS